MLANFIRNLNTWKPYEDLTSSGAAGTLEAPRNTVWLGCHHNFPSLPFQNCLHNTSEGTFWSSKDRYKKLGKSQWSPKVVKNYVPTQFSIAIGAWEWESGSLPSQNLFVAMPFKTSEKAFLKNKEHLFIIRLHAEEELTPHPRCQK